MQRASGYGHYHIVTDFTVIDEEGQAHRLQAKAITNDSQLWDEDDRDAEMIFERAETLIEDSIQREIEQKL